jgi:hypothetical protein
MAIACSCRVISLAHFEEAVKVHKAEIEKAPSLTKAAAHVFRQTRKTCGGPETGDCGLCIGHIEDLIAEFTCPKAP